MSAAGGAGDVPPQRGCANLGVALLCCWGAFTLWAVIGAWQATELARTPSTDGDPASGLAAAGALWVSIPFSAVAGPALLVAAWHRGVAWRGLRWLAAAIGAGNVAVAGYVWIAIA